MLPLGAHFPLNYTAGNDFAATNDINNFACFFMFSYKLFR